MSPSTDSTPPKPNYPNTNSVNGYDYYNGGQLGSPNTASPNNAVINQHPGYGLASSSTSYQRPGYGLESSSTSYQQPTAVAYSGFNANSGSFTDYANQLAAQLNAKNNYNPTPPVSPSVQNTATIAPKTTTSSIDPNVDAWGAMTQINPDYHSWYMQSNPFLNSSGSFVSPDAQKWYYLYQGQNAAMNGS